MEVRESWSQGVRESGSQGVKTYRRTGNKRALRLQLLRPSLSGMKSHSAGGCDTG